MTTQTIQKQEPKQTPVDRAITGLMENMAKRAVRLENLLPPEVPVARFLESIRLALAINPELADPAKTDPASVVLAVMEAARLGLDVHGHYGHLVRYGSKSGPGSCEFIPDYKGIVALAVTTGVVRDMQAVLVYERDVFEVEEGEAPHVQHKPYIPKRANDSRGAIIAAYTRVLYPDGARVVKGLLYADDIDRVESGAPKGGPWGGKHRPEMIKKTSIKNASKSLGTPSSEQAERLRGAIAADNRAEAIEGPFRTSEPTPPVGGVAGAKAALKARNATPGGDIEPGEMLRKRATVEAVRSFEPNEGAPTAEELAEIRRREQEGR